MTRQTSIGAATARSLVERLGDDCAAATALAERLGSGMAAHARGATIGGFGPAVVSRAATDFVNRGWRSKDAAGLRRTLKPLPAGLAAFLAGAQAMRSVSAARMDAVASAVVTLPAAPTEIAGALPLHGPIHASLEKTEEMLGALARASVASFAVMSHFVNHDVARFAMRSFEDCCAPKKTLITRLAGSTRVVVDDLRTTRVRVLDYLLLAAGGHETFHAKAVISDADQAYVGSAKMTRYARHSMELGVMLTGRQARAASAVVRAVEGISRPVLQG